MATNQEAPVKLPKYVQNANKIIEVIADQPDKVWSKTQRELGELLAFSQPELSTLLKLLIEEEKIKRGTPLPGVRGKNFVLELTDDTLFSRPLARNRRKTGTPGNEDRALSPDEDMSGSIDLGGITVEKIGHAVMRVLRDSWENEERFTQYRAESNQKMREYREQIVYDRRSHTQLQKDKEQLERKVHDMEHVQTQLRAEVNTLIMRMNEKSGNTYQLRDLVPDDSLKALEAIMKGKPGHYRESDRELGLAEAS